MAKAIRVDNHGGPDVLKPKDVDVPEPGDGEALIQHKAIGLNYIDIYHRSGLYPVPGFPFTPGLEAAGVVAKAGPALRTSRKATGWSTPARPSAPTPRKGLCRRIDWYLFPKASTTEPPRR